MLDLPPLGFVAILVLLVVLLVFALGTRRNIQKGNDILRWLQGGLPVLGTRTSFRWLGSSAVVLTIVQANEPFRQAEVVVVMEPRDVMLWWLWSRRRGRRDFLILRGILRRAPSFDLEAADAAGWTGRDRLRRPDPESWERADWGPGSPTVAHGPGADPAVARRLWTDLAEASSGVWRLSVRRREPHLEVHVLPPAAATPAERLIRTFADVGRAVSRTS
jgi:hypothetical protein